MLRRTAPVKNLNKQASQVGPALQGWGRSIQKRRLEYEGSFSKYGKKEFQKQWDLAGLVQRSTDYYEVRTYFSIGSRWSTWIFNSFTIYFWALSGCFTLKVMHEAMIAYHWHIVRAAWW